MPEFFKLNNYVKHYEWGSPDWIPRLLGLANTGGKPWAELWMGSHPGASSTVTINGGEITLADFIARNTEYCLGEQAAEQYGALPFLFKVLAAQAPLSIQAHPNLVQAREGFERENKAGIAIDAPNRNYRDSNHKPEIICALTPFTGMCGFRPPDEIRSLLRAFLSPPSCLPPESSALRQGFAPLFAALDTADTTAALRNFVNALFGLSAALRNELTAYIACSSAIACGRETTAGLSPLQWELMGDFAARYPGDPALVSPLYLNIFHLKPGEAIFLRDGVLHAYIHGLGVELMANSDNVLRGGLSLKHIDVPELLNILDYSPLRPEILRPNYDAGAAGSFCYPAACDEFSLLTMSGGKGTAAPAPNGPAICIVTAGELHITGGESRDGMILKTGESVFLPACGNNGKPLMFEGTYTLYAATLPQAAIRHEDSC
ncbi:MAG: mannose-6-phosphate isomerase, class I [Treponema sp.]|jgi:mannose-6-phosphate isomerase|nr:mannose-6-phosphate isomerase, class I [Treponema sp.]